MLAAAATRFGRSAGSAIAAVVGPDEIQFWLGLALVAAGLWSVWRPGAYLAPGLVLVWSSLPSRAPFIARAREASAPETVHRKRAA